MTHAETGSESVVNPRAMVTYFDILGWKKKSTSIMEDPEGGYGRIISQYESILDDVAQYKIDTNAGWFSDTFLLYTHHFFKVDERVYKEMAGLLTSSMMIFVRLMLEGYPVRGAIDIGDFYTTEYQDSNEQGKKIYLGTALIDAYKYAENQDWAGISLTPNCYNFIKNSDIQSELIKNGIHHGVELVEYEPPCKQGKIHKSYVINWVDAFQMARIIGDNEVLGIRNMELTKKTIKKMFLAHLDPDIDTMDWRVKRKIDNTLKFVEKYSRDQREDDESSRFIL